MVLGRLVHYGVDLVLVSTILAGMRRSTGLTLKQEKIGTDNTEINKWVGRYLGIGESVFDLAVGTAGQSGWFERTR
ncbi:unnamed protein product [Discula destructiva]